MKTAIVASLVAGAAAFAPAANKVCCREIISKTNDRWQERMPLFFVELAFRMRWNK